VEKISALDDPNKIYEVYKFDKEEDIFDIAEDYKNRNIKDGYKSAIKVKEIKEDGENAVIIFEEFDPILIAILILHARKCLTTETTNVNSLLEVGLGTILEEHMKQVEAQKQIESDD
jgi:hypothetical protein